MVNAKTVLVAGAGPVGLTLAYELTRRGIDVRLIDAACGPAETSRAIATHPRTLETYDQMGLADEFLDQGQPIEGFTMFNNGHRLVRLDADYRSNPTAYPFTLSIDQVRTESVLRAALSRSGVEVEWACKLTDLAETPDGVTVTLEHDIEGTGHIDMAGHSQEQTTAAWVVGCDGGHSTVRKLLELPLIGDSNETWLLADAAVRVDLPRNSIYWIRVGAGTLMLVPLPGQDRWRMLDTVDVTGADDPDLIADRFAAKLARGLGRVVSVGTPTWISVFTAQQRMVPAMRRGRCLVAGDAAHVHSPASGQGMNTGIQEAYNLGWKLAMVAGGDADAALLDSYDAERVPIGRALLDSTKQATSLVALRNAVAGVALPIFFFVVRHLTPLRNKIQNGILGPMSGLTIAYPDSPLTTVDSESSAGPKPGQRLTIAHGGDTSSAGWTALRAELRDLRWTLLILDSTPTDLDPAPDWLSVRIVGGSPADSDQLGAAALPDPDGTLRVGLGGEPGAWLLVRPDGYLAARGSTLSRDALRAALSGTHLWWEAAVTVSGGR